MLWFWHTGGCEFHQGVFVFCEISLGMFLELHALVLTDGSRWILGPKFHQGVFVFCEITLGMFLGLLHVYLSVSLSICLIALRCLLARPACFSRWTLRGFCLDTSHRCGVDVGWSWDRILMDLKSTRGRYTNKRFIVCFGSCCHHQIYTVSNFSTCGNICIVKFLECF